MAKKKEAAGKSAKKWVGGVTEVTIPKQLRTILSVPIWGLGDLVTRRFHKLASDIIEARRRKKEGLITQAEFDAIMVPLTVESEELYDTNMYLFEDGTPGIRSVAFKAAMTRAVKMIMPEVPMNHAQLMFYVNSDPTDTSGDELVKLNPGYKLHRRRTQVGTSGGQFYHTAISEWTTTLDITYPPDLVRPQQLLGLLQYAGEFIGVGAFRPGGQGSSGTKGRFALGKAKDIGAPAHRAPKQRKAAAKGRARNAASRA